MPKVNHDIMRWARETAGLTVDQAVDKLGINDARGVIASDRLAAIEQGAVEPSRPLLLKMAQQYRRPLVAFYMSAVPQKGDRGQDFRNIPDRQSGAETLIDALVRDIRARQSTVRDVLMDEEETRPLPFIGSMTMADGVETVVELDSTYASGRSRRISRSKVSGTSIRTASFKSRSRRRVRSVDWESWKSPYSDRC